MTKKMVGSPVIMIPMNIQIDERYTKYTRPLKFKNESWNHEYYEKVGTFTFGLDYDPKTVSGSQTTQDIYRDRVQTSKFKYKVFE
ncbi:MAG: hypothetical protein SFU98_12930 [Leptospiraceae bacterium]|nr:hypothetical protein [Leptospiraceae bacterium]